MKKKIHTNETIPGLTSASTDNEISIRMKEINANLINERDEKKRLKLLEEYRGLSIIYWGKFTEFVRNETVRIVEQNRGLELKIKSQNKNINSMLEVKINEVDNVGLPILQIIRSNVN